MADMVTLREGMDVYGADGDKLGSIDAVFPNYVSVKKGFFFPEDHYVPISSIQGVDEDDKVWLTVTKDEALNQGWDQLPEGGYNSTDTGEYVATEREAATTGAAYAAGDYVNSEQAASGARGEVIDPNFVAEADVTAASTDATRVPVYEEELTPVKRDVDRGAVRIEKEVVTEERTINVPVTEERVRITQVDTNNQVVGDAVDAFQEGTVEVPLRGEEVGFEKTVRKTGEVVVDTEQVQRQEQVSGTVRREEVHVDDETVADANLRNKKR
jgi:uncharacterized protein (TIGR02271 family)